MGEKEILFKSEEWKSRSDLSAFLHQLADRVSEGRVVLRQGREEFILNLPHDLVLELQVDDKDKGSKGIQHKLEVEIKWFDEEREGPLELG